MAKSIEPIVKSWGDRQIENLGWSKIGPEQISVDKQIDESLTNNLSKQGGTGGGRPDYTLMITDGNKTIPVLVEYKGTKGKLVSLTKKDNLVQLYNVNHEYDFKKSISQFAVNGAVYYASNIVRDTDYKEVLAIGINGYYGDDGQINYQVSTYLITDVMNDVAIFFDDFTDLSFFKKSNISNIIKKVHDAQLNPEELHKNLLRNDADLDKVLKNLNQHLRDETRIRVGQRIFIVAASIMAALGVKDDDDQYTVSPLEPDYLTGDTVEDETDGDKILRRAKSFLKARKIPLAKQKQIINSLQQTLLYSNLEIKDSSLGMSPLRSAYQEVYDNVIPAFKRTGSIDFTGKLFNVMNDWVDVPDGDVNDVVLTPRYVTDLMAKLARVDMNSYVWDWALGSGGFLISSMNQMIADASVRISSPDKKIEKIITIKTQQLLGIEKLPDIYILAVLNMILMGDGSTNILNQDSLTEFNGAYAYGSDSNKEFPANVFLLNPPYSAPGNGLIFVKRAFDKMNGGFGAVIIQDSAGSGRGTDLAKEILKNNRLLASIKMPIDLFKASVQTSIYLFEINHVHKKDDIVKFVDFRNDGYKRSNRKKASTNLSDTGTAKQRYDELVSIIKNGAKNAEFFKDGEFYFEDTIDPTDGTDWNLEKHQVRDIKPTEDDFTTVISNYVSWEVKNLLTGGIDND